jgi:Fe-S cluster biogenesis protein NfuA
MQEHSSQGSEPGKIVAALRPLVEGDGARLEFVAMDRAEGSVSLRLVLDDVDCLDCVMPREFLEQMSLNVVRSTAPHVERVIIDDPREHAGTTSAQAATH